MKKTAALEMLPDEFKRRMRLALGETEYNAFLESYHNTPARGLLTNTLRISTDEMRNVSPWSLIPCTVSEQGFILGRDADGAGKHPYHMAGLFYLQEPSAMSAGAAAPVRENMRVLDMCAAPGGKTAALATKLNGSGVIVSNDIIMSRATELARNVERLGIVNSVVTSLPPADISRAFPYYFDVIIVDAPCSGEGMFRKTPEAIAEWSPKAVEACARRQLDILREAAYALKPDGTIVYSTCTFEHKENKGVIDLFLNMFPEFEIKHIETLYPHTSEGEGHFVCVLHSTGEHVREARNKERLSQNRAVGMKPCKKNTAFYDFINETFSVPPQADTFESHNGNITLAVNEDVLYAASKVGHLYSGIPAGIIKNNRFEPSHSLFMAAHGGKYLNALDFEPDSKTLTAYLRGEQLSGIVSETIKGYCAVTVNGYALGFGKISHGELKNKLPRGLRVNRF